MDILTYRRINKSPMALDDPEKAFLKKFLTTPPVKKIDLHFPLGLEVTARNMKGVTIKDACDAIYKQFRKKVRSYRLPVSVFMILPDFPISIFINHRHRNVN